MLNFDNYENDLFNKYNNESDIYNEPEESLDFSMDRRQSNRIAYDKIIDGKNYHHTGWEVWLGKSWWNEFKSDDGKITYA